MIKKLLFTLLFTLAAIQLNAQENGAVCGAIFNDLNGDGALNEGEPGVSGIYIIIISAPPSEDIFVPQVTDENGNYCFTGLSVGIYTFAIEVPEGWTMSGQTNQFTVTITDDTVLNGYRYGVTATMAAPQIGRNLFSIYPNPASSVLYIRLQNPVHTGVITLTEISGKQLFSQVISATETSIDISRLPAGIYIASMIAGNGVYAIRLAILR